MFTSTTSIEKLKTQLEKSKDTYTKRGTSCERLTDATYSSSVSSNSDLTLNYEYITKAQRENTDFNISITNGLSASQKALALVGSDFYDNVASRIKTCVESV